MRWLRIVLLGAGALLPLAAGAAEPLRVFAAVSLTEPFRALAADWRAEPEISFQFAASSTLAVQIEEGAPADVVATADEPTMLRLAAKGHVEGQRLLARSRLVVVVEEGNPKQIAALADLARSDLIVVLAAPEVPAGRYARQLLDAGGVRVAPRSLEENVKAVLQKVVLGEADAGIVYASDVRAAGDRVQAVEVAEAGRVEVSYWIAPLRASKQAASARAFVDRVLSPAGRTALEQAGFSPP